MEVLEELLVMCFFVTACFLVTIASFLQMTVVLSFFPALNEFPSSSQVLLFPISFFLVLSFTPPFQLPPVPSCASLLLTFPHTLH